jgi:hypothetical protein
MNKLQCRKNLYKRNEERLNEQLNKLVDISETRKGEFGDKPGTTFERNSEASSLIHYRGREISVTYSECVYVALIVRHAAHMSHIVICDLSGCTTFFLIIS